MARVVNFNAGPAGLPLPVLERAREELIDFAGTGMSIMEHSHRGKAYEGVHNEAIALLRKLVGIGDDYHVLFLQGGASQQFAQIPMNFLPIGKSADYVVAGSWGKLALDEAQVVGKARAAASSAADKYTRIPKQLDLDPAAAYVHVTTNNTIEGTQLRELPAVGNVPLIADASSDFLWRRTDVSPYAMIYAGAQKNLGPSGVTIVILKKALVEAGRTDIPKIFRYSTAADNNSLYNTPPTFAIYLVRNVLAWVDQLGGLAALETRNEEKGRRLYATIDADPEYFRAPVAKEDRSVMNVVFRLPTEALEEQFVKDAQKANLVGLKGHRSVGGIRASIYNAVSVEDVDALCGFMRAFAAKHRP
jgi:phosphoserine aminotransferase